MGCTDPYCTDIEECDEYIMLTDVLERTLEAAVNGDATNSEVMDALCAKQDFEYEWYENRCHAEDCECMCEMLDNIHGHN